MHHFPFSVFMRLKDLWADASNLTDVKPIPEDPEKVIHVGNDKSAQAVLLRVHHMVRADGANPIQQAYQVPRFFNMMRFLARNEAAFAKAGFPVLNDGEVATATNDMLRAVYEEFKGIAKDADSVPVEPVVERAKSYPPNWTITETIGFTPIGNPSPANGPDSIE